MKNRTRKEHIVPQAHLKNFSFKNKNTDKVIVIDKNKDEPYPSSIDDVACQRNFYEVSDKQTNYWEQWYWKIEKNIPNIYNSVAINARFSSNGKIILSDYLKKELSLIIVSQMMRTEVSKKYFTEIGFDITSNMIENTKQSLKGLLTDNQIGVLDKYKNNEDFIYSSALEHLNSDSFIKLTTKILQNKIWIVHRNLNYKKMPFVTSDNPVFLYNLYTNKVGFGNNGLMKEGTIIYFPINKELLIAIYPKFKNLEKYNNKIDYLDDPNFVINFGKLNYMQCERQVFYSIK